MNALLFSSFLAACDGDDTTEVTLDEAYITQAAERAVAAGIPGVIVVVREGDHTFRVARGVADLESGAPLSTDHHVRMASMAKSFTAAVTLQLIEEGRLDLQDTLADWLPEAIPQGNAVTVEQLLRQQSGLPDYSWDPRHMAPYIAGDADHYWSPAELIAMAAGQDMAFTPGARYQYSNTNFTLLALIIEEITGQSYAEAVAERISGPLGLQHTSMPTDGAMPVPFAHGYMVDGETPLDATGISGSAVFGAGNLVSTADDMTIFYGALAAGQVVKRPLLAEMLRKDDSVPETHYGMGVFRFDAFYPCGDFVGHDGGIPGYDTVAYARVDGKRQFAVLVNSFTFAETAGDAAAHQAFLDVVLAAACR